MYSSDLPLISKDGDLFSRWDFSRKIGEIVRNRTETDSLVIGLYGPWGDGKSTVLNFIESSLMGSRDIVIVKFNPWRFHSEDEILAGLFRTIAKTVDSELFGVKEKIGFFLKKSSEGIGALLGQADLGRTIGDFINGPNLNIMRQRVEEALEKSGKKLLLVFDDIDRLPKAEIQLIFKTVKLILGFRRTTFILAFDKDVVAAALQDSYSSVLSNAGDSFLEKIIQVPIVLPKIEPASLRKLCYKEIDSVLLENAIELSQDDVQNFTSYFQICFDDLLTTPRKVKLYCNTIKFSIPLLAGEVNISDLLLLEAAKIFLPSVYYLIEKNGLEFCGYFPTGYGIGRDTDKERIEVVINTVLESLPGDLKTSVRSLLRHLFPKLDAVFANVYHHDSGDLANAQSRLHSASHFRRFFSYAIVETDISDKTIDFVLKELATNDPRTALQRFDEAVSSTNIDSAVRKLRQKQTKYQAQALLPLVMHLSGTSDTLPDPESMFGFDSPFVRSAMFVAEVLSRLPKDEISVASTQIVDVSPILRFGVTIFDWMKTAEEETGATSLTQAEVQEIRKSLAPTIVRRLQSDIVAEKLDPRVLARALFLVRDALGSTASQYLARAILESPAFGIDFVLDAFAASSWDMGGKKLGKSYERSHFDALDRVFPREVVTQKILEKYRMLKDNEKDLPRHSADPNDNILALQVLWYYANVHGKTT